MAKSKLKALLKLSLVTILKAIQVKLEEIKTDAGAILQAEVFEAGEPVFILEEDVQIPLPVGEYTLEDGRMLKVEEEGIIASITEAAAEETPAETPAEEAPVEEAKEQKMYSADDIKKMIEDALKVQASKYDARINELETKMGEENIEGIKPNPEGKPNADGINLSGKSTAKTALSRVLDNLYSDN